MYLTYKKVNCIKKSVTPVTLHISSRGLKWWFAGRQIQITENMNLRFVQKLTTIDIIVRSISVNFRLMHSLLDCAPLQMFFFNFNFNKKYQQEKNLRECNIQIQILYLKLNIGYLNYLRSSECTMIKQLC